MRTATFLLILLAPAAAWAQTTVSGSVTYEDKMYTSSGFTGVTRPLPARLANFEIVDSSTGVVVGSGTTDASGNFGPVSVTTGESVFLRVYSRVNNGSMSVVVKNDPGDNVTYTVASGSMTLASGANTLNLFIQISGGAAGVFNIFDMGVLTWEYLATLPGFAAGPTLTFYWFSGSTNGTYFSRGSNAIFLLGASTDPDEFDDDVILHECGHWVAFNYSLDNSPGGSHTILDVEDVRLSWSEGWAHYWSATVRRYAQNVWGTPFGINRYSSGGTPASVDPWVLVDNFGSGFSVFDIQTPSFSSQTVTAQNEIAIAYGLWRITTDLDTTPPSLQNLIFQCLEDFKSMSLTNISLEKFQQRWIVQASAGVYLGTFGNVSTSGVYKNRLVRYYSDGSEPNNSMAAAATLAIPSTTTQLTFFPAGNQDWFKFTSGPGLLIAQTLNLGDGADTVLELYDSTGTLLASNDDQSFTSEASLIQFTLPATGTYFLHVFSFAGAGAITQYGYYDLSVSVSVNYPPTITASAGATAVTAPARVSFTATATDPDDSVHLYEWDFEGIGVYTYSSLNGGDVTHTYDRAGAYNATVRVTDSRGLPSLASIAIVVSPSSSPTITVSSNVVGSNAPLTATFTINVSGTTAVAYEFDFDGDGVTDAASVTSNMATFTYALPGAYAPRFIVHDTAGRAFLVTLGQDKSIVVGTGTSPPSISSFTASGSSGSLPFTSLLSVIPSGESATLVEWDPYGRGTYDLTTTVTSAVFQYQRAGNFTAKARVTFTSGRQATATTPVTVTTTTAAGWMVEPRGGDRIAGNSVELTAEAAPSGVSKTVQFQYRQNSPAGPWINIGSALSSTGTRFSTTWDVSSFTPLTAWDLRILVNGTFSSGDTSNTVSVNPFVFDINESATSKQRNLKASVTAYVSFQGASLVVPAESHASDGIVTLSFETPPSTYIFATDIPRGQAIRVDGSLTFTSNFLVRLPLPPGVDPSILEVRWLDAASGQWKRDYFSDVRPDDGFLEVRSSHTGLFAVFISFGGGGGSGGGGGCGGPVQGNLIPFGVILLILLIARFRRWKSRSSSQS